MTGNDDDLLGDMFAAARADRPDPSDALMDRIMMDADGVLAGRENVTQSPARRGSVWRGLLEGIGGWMPLGGLTAATLAGFWIGVAPPDLLSGATAALWSETISLPLLESDVLSGLEDAL